MAGFGTQYGSRRYGLELDDLNGPLVYAVQPKAYQTDVALDSNIIIEVTDEDGIIPNTLMVRVDRGYGFVTAYNQAETPAFKPGYSGPASAIVAIVGGFQVTIDPETDFGNAEKIFVEVTANDPSGRPERLL